MFNEDGEKKVGDQDGLLCPSAFGHPGALVIGERGMNQAVVFFDRPMPVTTEFIEENTAKDSLPLEKKFRFASECLESGCDNWNNGECGLANRFTEFQVQPQLSSRKNCKIRSKCRWFNQSGISACSACTWIPTRI
jgi:hypothetical protein